MVGGGGGGAVVAVVVGGAVVGGTVAGGAVVDVEEVDVLDDVLTAGRVVWVARGDEELHALDATPVATTSAIQR